MTKRIFLSTIKVVLLALLLSLGLIIGVLYEHFQDLRLDELKAATAFVSEGMNESGMDYLEHLEGDNYRITWVVEDGTVLFDNEYNSDEMENHADREEIKEAMENSSGISVRRSSTLSENTLYYAIRQADGTVLRMATAQSSVLLLVGGMLTPFCFILLATCIFAGLLSYRVSKKIVKPLSEIDLRHPEQVETYDELSPFLQRIVAQNREINLKIEEIQKQQHEFSMITENMSEGLFVIDHNYQILSYNKSTMKIFSMIPDFTYQSLLSVNRSENFRNVVDSALQGRHTQQNLELNGRVYQIIASAVHDENVQEDLVGAVILVLDITEKEEQERYRREFTANVSHELKTPLTSISGIAEIIRGGIVRQEDIPHFAGKIYEESQRLITLIGDIIKLSQLDENEVTLDREQVDLLEVSRNVVKQLTPIAHKNGITLAVKGSHGTVFGIRQVLMEMIYNLCENAIKYNKKDGYVWISVQKEEQKIVVSISDSGIGIPASAQARVFERFYRVDKSHSKAVSGTGLGLSIVKHGAALHHAEVELESEEGEGTTITLTFPI